MKHKEEIDKEGENSPHYSEERKALSEERTELSEERTELSEDRTQMSKERTELAQGRTEMAQTRTRLSRQRTHLANERTFQAWVRTSLSLIGFGFVIERFILYIRRNEETYEIANTQFNGTYSIIVGVLMIMIGVLLVIVAYMRYRHTSKIIGSEDYVSSKWLPVLVTLSIVVAGALILLDLFINL